MRPADDAFTAAWPSVVRQLAAHARSIDEGEELAAEAFARAVAHPDEIDDLVAWCTTVGRRLHLDRVRRGAVRDRALPDLARRAEARVPGGTGVDDRLALLHVACDPALGFGSRLVLALRLVCGLDTARIAWHLGIDPRAASARLTRAKRGLAEAAGAFRVPDRLERRARLPAVLECVAAVHAVGQRDALQPDTAADDLGRGALTLATAASLDQPDDAEARALVAVVLLALARRPGRFDDEGVALPLDEVDRTRWDRRLALAGLERAAATAGTGGRFALEASIAALHVAAPTAAATDWTAIAGLHERLVALRPSPAARVAAAVARGRLALRDGGDLDEVAAALARLEHEGAEASRRDASLALADLAWQRGERAEAAARYATLADALPAPLAAFARRRAALA
ncbi:putative RNA polymerase sigma factor [Agrococcus sp. UYP10]|uniref:DUF6596 domain-containing protein n=1 Tax=Agrococcus sp. UYP10 TaxID=1756355 RepID=UPI0033908A78